MELSERLRALRKAKGMTQEELASALYVTRQSVYKWESGKALPDVDKLRQICGLFGVSSDSVLGLTQESPESADAAQSMPPTEACQASPESTDTVQSMPPTEARSQTTVTPPCGGVRDVEDGAREENGAAFLPLDGEGSRAIARTSTSTAPLLEASEDVGNLPIARRTSESAPRRPTAPKRRRMLWMVGVALLAAGLLLWRGLPSLLYPQEVRDAQADGMLPADWVSLSSDAVSERELLHLLNTTASLRLGAESPALKAAWNAATNERVTREKAAYWLYCAHIWTTIDPTAALHFDGEITETSMRDQYQDMNAAGRAYVESLDAPWEWRLCRELAETGALFDVYDGSVAMDAQINAILDGRCYAAVAFCLAQKSFVSNRTVLEADDARFRPKERITAREAVVAARRLYESW